MINFIYLVAMKKFPRSVIKFVFLITASLLVGWWAYMKSGSPEYSLELSRLEWYQIPLLCGIIILGSLIRSWRLSYFFCSVYGNFRETLKVLFFSLSFSFLFGGIGLVIRMFLLRKTIGARHVVSLGFISVEKLIDLVIAFVVFFFLFDVPDTHQPTISWINENKNIIFIPFMVFLITFYLNQRRFFHGFLFSVKAIQGGLHIPKRYYYFVKRQIFYLYKSLQSLPLKRILIFFGHSTILFVTESSFYYFGLQALGIDVALINTVLLNAVILLALLIPLFPSGIGLFQAAMVLVLGGSVVGGSVFYASLLLHFFLIVTHVVIITVGLYLFFDFFKKQGGRLS